MQTRDDHIGWRIMGNVLVFTAFLATMRIWYSRQDNAIAQSFVNIIPSIWGAVMVILLASLWGWYRVKYDDRELSNRFYNKKLW